MPPRTESTYSMRNKLLEDLEKEIRECRECGRGKQGRAVPGEGDPHARRIFIGEAPGRDEAATGRPFTGRSGKLLTKMLEAVGIDRKDVYITSPVKYYPGKRAPTKKEIDHGSIHLKRQIDAISPDVIVLMGRTAIQAMLPGKRIMLGEDHGRFMGRFFITYHPAAALRFPEIRKLMESDLRKLAEHELP